MGVSLLSLTQNILSSLDSDEVNSIFDTVESTQVAEIIKETFYELFSNVVLPEQNTLIQLEGVGDILRPNYLVIPDSISDIHWIKYIDDRNTSKYKDVCYVSNDKFLDIVLQTTNKSSNVSRIQDLSGAIYYIKNNSAPTYYTLFDDKYIVLDSYDSVSDDTLHSSKTLAYGKKNTVFSLSDDYKIPIDDSLIPLLLAESKSVCFINLKQISSAKEENRSRRQRIRWQKGKYKSSSQNGERKSFNFARNRW